MSSLAELARWTVIIGVSITVLGGLIWLLAQIPGLNRMPGTWTWESDNVRIVAPIGLMILLSIVLTVVLNIVVRLFR